MQQFFVATTLGLAYIDAEVYHAELSTTERQDLFHWFTTEQDSCMVLICSYYINSAGSNMQAQCWNYYLFDLPLSNPLEMQAIRCILHLGQQSTVKVYSYIVTDSFNIKQLIKNVEKALPEITTQLNISLFGSTLKNNSVSLDCWV